MVEGIEVVQKTLMDKGFYSGVIKIFLELDGDSVCTNNGECTKCHCLL